MEVDGNGKCLDDLPEAIVRHILSFLPTKDAFRTSVLSKSWVSRWSSIPNLDFARSSRIQKRNRRGFMNFVERVLCLRDSCDIKRFSLHCDVLRDAFRVNTWISAAVRHNVQELVIELDNFNEEFSLPYCLFTCKTLTELILDMPCILKLPTTICFSNLTILVIHGVTFSDDRLTQQFFSSGLPVLLELGLSDCSWGSLKVMRLSAPNLRSLSIGDFKSPGLRDGGGCQITISALSLLDFNYKGRLCNGYCLDESSSLEEAEIYAHLEDYTSDLAHRMYELLEGLSNLELLGISWGVVEVFFVSEQEGLLDSLTFNNLTHLIVEEGLSHDADFAGLLWILHKCPCLNTLKFVEGIIFSLQGLPDDPQPSSFLSNLKVIEVCDYEGFSEELFAVKFLLKHAAILDTISIIGSEIFASRDLGDRERHYKELVEFPRSSQNCNIVVHY